VVFLACVHLALYLALSLSSGQLSLVSSWCDHSMLASLDLVNGLIPGAIGVSESVGRSALWRLISAALVMHTLRPAGRC